MTDVVMFDQGRKKLDMDTHVDQFIMWRRVECLDVSTSLGCAERNYVTGEIDFKRMRKYPDYCVVDIYNRARPPPTVNGCKQDKYLFKAYPLTARTWLYHSIFNKGIMVSGAAHDENHLIRHVLSQSAIDAPTINGLGSPLPAYVPLSFGVCLLNSNIAVLGTIVFIMLLRRFWADLNTAEHYKWARVASLLPRMGFLGFLLALADLSGFLGLAGLALVVGAWMVDFIIGDLAFFITFRLNCHYDILTAMGNRTYICWRNGAMTLEESFGDSGKLDESVCGMASWERCHTLIADIGDIIVELRPMTGPDWTDAMEKFYAQGNLAYICTKVFEPVENASTLDGDYQDGMWATSPGQSGSKSFGGLPGEMSVEDY